MSGHVVGDVVADDEVGPGHAGRRPRANDPRGSSTVTPRRAADRSSWRSMSALSSTPMRRAAGGHERQGGPPAPTADVQHGSVGREHLALERRRRGARPGPRPPPRSRPAAHVHGVSGAWPRISSGIAQAGQLLGPPRRRVADRVHRAIMPGDGDALRHRLGGDRRRAARRSPPSSTAPTSRTWREYDERAARFAGGARRRPAWGRTARSASTSTTRNEYLEAQFGGFKARAVPVNVNYRYLDDELAYLLDNADAEALVFHTSLGDRVARVPVPPAPAQAAGGGRRRPAGGRQHRRRRRAVGGRARRARADGAHRPPRGRHLHALHRRHDRACPRASCTRWAGSRPASSRPASRCSG